MTPALIVIDPPELVKVAPGKLGAVEYTSSCAPGLAVPTPIRPLESITKTLEPPEILENTTTFVPSVPGPTSRPLFANTFTVERAFEA